MRSIKKLYAPNANITTIPTVRRHPLAGAAPRFCRRALLFGMCDRSAPTEMPAGTPAGRCPLEVLSRTGGPCAPLSVQKHTRLSGQFGEALRKNCNFWRDPGAFVHDCLVIVSSVLLYFYARIRCVGEQIFLNINDDNITVGIQLLASYGCQISNPKRGKLCLMKFSLHYHVLYEFCLKAKVTV